MEIERERERGMDMEKRIDVGDWKGDMGRKGLGNGSRQIY